MSPLKKYPNFLLFLLLLTGSHFSYSQGFNNTEYKKALWMTTRMYGGQRSGENNWLVYNHLPDGVDESLRGKCFIGDKDFDGYDLAGGWHDCGDHVKFGQTQFYSAYMLIKGFDEFPTGYDDYYSYDYKGYKAGGDWTWEGNNHDPNEIPDILDEVKHATDYFIKCTRNSNTFYSQVGDGDFDHSQWVTAVKMQTLPVSEGGQRRLVLKNPNDASMPSFCGATLAIMSKVYRKYDPAYADSCLKHAFYAYEYAKSHPGTIPASPFYGANSEYQDDFASLCAELYWATGNSSYKTEALNYSINKFVYGHNRFEYYNNEDIAVYNLAKLGNTAAITEFTSGISKYYISQTLADGQFSGGDGWGTLRYNANAAFIVALWQKLKNESTVHKFIYDNIDYVLGKNSKNYSFVVGFGDNYPQHPHHRNIYLDDRNLLNEELHTLVIPEKNRQIGMLLGGTKNPNDFKDDINIYQQAEGGIDYNACLVGVLGYINSKKAPVDTNKFNHITPNLGLSQTLCGVTSITINSKVAIDGIKTFTWKKDNTIYQPSSTTTNSITVTEPGIYTCILDSLGKWSRQGSVSITNTLPNVNIGPDIELCDQTTVVFDMGVGGPGITYEWQKNGVIIGNAKEKTYTAIETGVYRATIHVTGCASKYDEATVTSRLYAVSHDTICKPGIVDLKVLSTGGPYEWYSAPSGSTPLYTGPSYSPKINTSTTFYVKDANSFSAIVGPSSVNHTLTGIQSGYLEGFRFQTTKGFNITQLKIIPNIYLCNDNEKVSVTFQLQKDNVTIGTYATKPLTCQGAGSSTMYTIDFTTPIVIPGAGNYTLQKSGGSQLMMYSNGANFSTFDAPGIMDITDDLIGFMPNSFPAIFDIKIQAGSTCARTPVYAIIDQNVPCKDCNGVVGGSAYIDNCEICVGGNTGNTECTITAISTSDFGNKIDIFPNPFQNSFKLEYNLEGNENVKIEVFNLLGETVSSQTGASKGSYEYSFSPGIYNIRISNSSRSIVRTIIGN